jgi:hypothetical protein
VALVEDPALANRQPLRSVLHPQSNRSFAKERHILLLRLANFWVALLVQFKRPGWAAGCSLAHIASIRQAASAPPRAGWLLAVCCGLLCMRPCVLMSWCRGDA